MSILEKPIIKLIMSEPYYAEAVMAMKVHIDDKIPTAGVNITDTVNLFVNPHFFQNQALDCQVEILKHEILHILLNHHTRFAELMASEETPGPRTLGDVLKSMLKPSALNQAADYAINEHLRLPDKMPIFNEKGEVITEMTPCLVRELKKQFPNVENLQTLEYYYKFLQEKNSGGEGGNQTECGNGGSTIDDHGIWAEGSKEAEYIKEKAKQFANEVAKRTQEKHAGGIPLEIQSLIDKLNFQPKNWKSDLQRFVARTAETIKIYTRKKRNRRYGLIVPGIKRYPLLSLAVLFDASGSVDDDSCGQFFAEIGKLHEMGVVITVIEFDAQVNAVYKYNPKNPPQLHGRGGTCFEPPFAEAKKHEVDGIICFTDGCNFDEVSNPKVPVLWALLKGCSVKYDWGKRTEIIVKKKFTL